MEKWQIAYEEEQFSRITGTAFFRGVISNGKDFLFFKTDGSSDEDSTCHVYNSIVMSGDSEECSYPWTAENDQRLLDCLNSLDDTRHFCGECSPLRTLRFEPRCPFCGCDDVEPDGEDETGPRHHCPECDRLFGDDDIERESLRHAISLLLDGTSEESQRTCSITVGEEEACGLSSLELPEVDSCFQMEGDGKMFFHIYGNTNPETGEKHYTDFDDFTTPDLRAIYEGLSEQDTPRQDLPFDFGWKLAEDESVPFPVGQRICLYTCGDRRVYTRTDEDDIRERKGICEVYTTLYDFVRGPEPDLEFDDTQENRELFLRMLNHASDMSHDLSTFVKTLREGMPVPETDETD